MEILGVYDEALVEPLAEVLIKLGVKKGMVVFGQDVMDEITLSAKTTVCEIRDGKTNKYEINPEDYGFKICSKDDLVGGDAKANAEITREILNGKKGPKTDAVLLNAGACIYMTRDDVTYEEAKRFGIMNTDEDERIYEFEEKPAEPKSTKASMGIYIFKWKLIRQYLIDDGNDPESEHDFGKNIIPRMLEDGRKMYAYSFDGYWRDVGTIDSLWEANMELLDENPQIDLNDDKMRIYTRNFSLPPHYIAPGASVKNSILADGCVIEGEVENCVIHSGVKIGKGSVVKNSVIMKDTVVRTDCQIDKALIDEEVVIEQGCKVGEGNNVTVIGYHCVALENATVEDGAMIYPDTILH